MGFQTGDNCFHYGLYSSDNEANLDVRVTYLDILLEYVYLGFDETYLFVVIFEHISSRFTTPNSRRLLRRLLRRLPTPYSSVGPWLPERFADAIP